MITVNSKLTEKQGDFIARKLMLMEARLLRCERLIEECRSKCSESDESPDENMLSFADFLAQNAIANELSFADFIVQGGNSLTFADFMGQTVIADTLTFSDFIGQTTSNLTFSNYLTR